MGLNEKLGKELIFVEFSNFRIRRCAKLFDGFGSGFEQIADKFLGLRAWKSR